MTAAQRSMGADKKTPIKVNGFSSAVRRFSVSPSGLTARAEVRSFHGTQRTKPGPPYGMKPEGEPGLCAIRLLRVTGHQHANQHLVGDS